MTSEDPHIERIRQLDADFEAGRMECRQLAARRDAARQSRRTPASR